MIKALEKLRDKLEKEGSSEYLESVKDIIKYAKNKERALYTGAFLTPAGAQMLENWWGTAVQKDFLEKHFVHHMTIKYKPSEEEVVALPIGEDVVLKVIGYAENEKGQAVMVSGVQSTNKVPHVTISTAKEVGAVYSNELLGMGVIEVDGPELDARIGWAPEVEMGDDEAEPRYDFEDSIYE